MGLMRLTSLSLKSISNRYVSVNLRTGAVQTRWFANDKGAKNFVNNGTVNKEILKARKKIAECAPALTIYPQKELKTKINERLTQAQTNQNHNAKIEKQTKSVQKEEILCTANTKTREVLKANTTIVSKNLTNAYATNSNKSTESASNPKSSSIPPIPPSSQPPPSNNLWIAAVLATVIGGGAIAYNYGLFGSDDEKKKTVAKVPEPVQNKKIPATSAEIPNEVPYLLVGGGTASFAAFRAIKSHNPKAKVLVLSSEIETPYMRPPLSKELWLSGDANAASGESLRFKQWNGVERSLYYEPSDFYINPTKLLEEPNGGVAIVRGYTVASIDVFNRKAILTDGTEIKYGECLLATGSSPKSLDVIERAPLKVQEKCSVFKTIEDYENLKKIVDKSKSIAIIGGGFLGSELACALAKYGEAKKLKVHQIFHEKGNMGKVLPEFLSEWTTERVREEGVNVIPKAQVESVELVNGQLNLKLVDGKNVLCDHVVVAVGSEPNISLAQKSGLEVDSAFGGYLVNAELEARRHLYVAGDAACFYDPKLGRRRVEHHDHAVVSGRLAGENMVGLKKPYTHQSMFWSDLGPKVGYEAIGVIDSSLPTVSVFAKQTEISETDQTSTNSEEAKTTKSTDDIRKSTVTDVEKEDFGKGVVFYLRDEKIIGVVLWNVFNRINTARAVIGEGKKYEDLNEVAKLFDIHT